MRPHAPESGRALSLVLVIAAVLAIAFLLIADPLGLLGGGGDDTTGAGDGSPSLLGTDADATAAPSKPAATATLAGRYGKGDMGAIKARLLWVRSRDPLAGQIVQLLDRSGSVVTSLPSDPNGTIWFPQVHPAKGYQLHMRGEGFSEFTLQGVSVFPQATNDLGDIILGKDIVLRGRVVDANGRPLPGTSVSVHTIERQLATKGLLVYMAEQASTVPTALSQVQSDDEGYFAFSAVDDGTYSLVARLKGYASGHESDVIVAKARGAGVLTIVLGQGGVMTGKVTDAEGKPLADAQVIAIRDERRMMRSLVQREVALTDEKGRYTIDTLTADQSYRFGVVAKGYAPVYEVSGVRVTREDQEKDFALVKGGNLAGVVTDEQTGKPVEGARIAVYVGPMGFGRRNQKDGARAASDLRRSDAKGRFTFEALNPGAVASAVVQAPGYVTASFSMWPPPGNQWPDIVADETTEVTVALKRGGSISGHVSAKEGGEPIQGAEITLMQTGWGAMASMWVGTPTAISGSDGAYNLVGVLPGKYRMLAVAEGFSPPGGEEGVEIEVPATGGTQERDLTLISAGVVEGTVTDLEGEPIAGVKIRVRAGPAGEGGSRRGGRRGMNMARRMLSQGTGAADLSDKDGKFRLEGIGTDTMWVVYGESAEYVSGETKAFKLAAGETKKVELQMLPGGAIRGTVVDENGRLVAGVRVQVGRLPDDLVGKVRLSSWEARRALGSTSYTTDEKGAFFAPNLKPGRAIVRAGKDGYITFFKRNATVRPGETIENYTIALSRGEVVEGTVAGANGAPLSGATVALTTDPNPGGRGGAGEADDANAEPSEDVEPTMFARTDATGRYRIENVKPGTYSVVVWFAPGHKGWMRQNSEAAIQRNVDVPGTPAPFKLEKSEPAANPMGGGTGNRGTGRRGR